MSALVECPLCEGQGVLSNNHPDPQLQDDGDCHACSGGGAVTREHHAELVDNMHADAAERAVKRLADDDAQLQREVDELARDRDAEWWRE